MTAAIDVAGLCKSFGHTRALDGLDLTVAAGEVHGFLGPNGAGKTTTIRILLGLLRADGGTASLLGGDPWRDATTLHRRLAYVPGDVTLWPNLSGGEVIDLLGRLRGGIDAKRKDELLQRFELDPAKTSRAYSKGNRQKVALVAALASGADLLILDEPTSGLDPLMEAAFREEVAGLARSGTTVLLSSHILSEVEALCERVTIIRAGRAVDSGALSDLRHLTRTSVDADLARPAPGLPGLPGVHALDVTGTRVRCQVDNAALEEVLRQFTAAGVRSLDCRPPTLEELFLRHYGAATGEPAAGEPAHAAGQGPA
jgi:ABC-2 type transport system ATP-binding protein